MKRFSLLAIVLLASALTAFAAIPNLTCSEPTLVFVSTKNLKTQKMVGHTTFRFNESKLYLSAPDRDEYLYNDVREEELGRFVSGHKTILLDKDFLGGLIVHADSLDVRVSKIKCKKL